MNQGREGASFALSSRIVGHKGRVFDLHHSPAEPDVLVSAGEDTTCRVWHLTEQGHRCHVLRAHREECLVCGFSPGGDLIASGGNDNLVYVWDNGRLRSLELDQAEDAAESGDGAGEACGHGPGEACGSAQCEHHAGTDRPSQSRQLEGAQLARLDLPDQVYGCNFVGDNALMTSAGSCVTLWDLTIGEESAGISIQDDTQGGFVYGGVRNEASEVWIFQASLSGCSGMLAAACSDGFVRLYDAHLRSPKPLCRVRSSSARSCAATCCSFGASGTELACGWGDGWVSAWELRACRAMLDFGAHQQTVYKCGWYEHRPDGVGLVVTASRDHTVRLWDTAKSGQQHGRSLRHNDTVLSLAVSPLRPYIAFSGGNGGYIQNNQIILYEEVDAAADPEKIDKNDDVPLVCTLCTRT